MNGKNKVVALLRQQPYSRVALAQATGLGKPALTKVTRMLAEEGLIRENPWADTDSSDRTGRPATELALNEGHYFSAAMYVSIEGVSAYLQDISGKVHRSLNQPWQVSFKEGNLFSPFVFSAKLQALVGSLCAGHGIEVNVLKSVCIATQGKIAQHTGIIYQSQLLDEQNVPLASMLKNALGVPVNLYNIAWCSTFYFNAFNQFEDSYIALLLGYGLGTGICVDGRLIAGPDGLAPEVSHLTYDKHGPVCYCGARGCAEQYVTYNAIFEQAEQAGITLEGATPVEKLNHISELLNTGHPAVQAIINQVGDVLGHVAVQLMALLDVRHIYLNGETAILHEYLGAVIKEALERHGSTQALASRLSITHEPDNNVATRGLLELTNRSFSV